MRLLLTKQVRVFLLICLWAVLFIAFGLARVEAKSFYYETYDVDIVVNKDSTMDVTEKLTYVFDGTFSAVTRGIQLNNPDVLRACRNSGGLTCGGFEYLVLQEVKGDGITLTSNRYTAGIQENEDDGSSFYIIDWEFAPDGKSFNNEELTFELKYRVYGGVRFVGEFPYLYWNVLPRDKGGRVDVANVTIRLPQETIPTSNLNVYGNFNYETSVSGSTLKLVAKKLSATSDFTVAYKMNSTAILQPASVNIKGVPFGQQIFIDDVYVGDSDFEMEFFPAGRHKIRGEFSGYAPKTLDVDITPGSTQEIMLYLEPEPFTQVLIWLNMACIGLGCCLMPLSLIAAYMIWRRKGRDADKISTVIPLFKPPVNMRPYMVGSLIDEKVDKRDVSGTIIDLAYRGYLKIKELEKNKNYQFTRLKSDYAELTPVEVALMDALFGGSDEVESKNIGLRFVSRYPVIENKIYQQMVGEGLFRTSPKTTRNLYAGLGIGLIGGGIGCGVGITVITLAVIGYFGAFTLGISMALFGLGILVLANFMPAKTQLGSKLHNEILGFKMYLETAEKYRLQDLTPEEFERYLSYAVVFGVEEKWANSFKDIYNHAPEWYEGSSPDAFNIYWLTRSLNSFTNTMGNTVFTPVSSGSVRGSGWSGGGSFGGFSGGGGGGGFSGAR